MNRDRRSFLRVAGSSVLVGAGSALTRSAPAAQAPQTPAAPVSFPNVANPLEGPVEVIAAGYIWTEGPVWVGGEQGHLLFSDVPGNAIYSWDGKRATPFLAPSGYQGFPIPATLREAGSNGLAFGRGGLLLADSGTRAIVRVDLATRQRTILAESFQGKRFNSPNDLVLARNGDIYFTDPPFGLTNTQKSTLRELTYTGVFRVTPEQPGAPDRRQPVAERHRAVAGQPHALRHGLRRAGSPSISTRPAWRLASGHSCGQRAWVARAATA